VRLLPSFLRLPPNMIGTVVSHRKPDSYCAVQWVASTLKPKGSLMGTPWCLEAPKERSNRTITELPCRH